MVRQISAIPARFRRSQRLTITVPFRVLEALQQHSLCQGRSLSNLAAHLLECAVDAGCCQQGHQPEPAGRWAADTWGVSGGEGAGRGGAGRSGAC